MEFYKQLSYVKQLSQNLRQFKDMGNNVYKFRCVVCGDSKKDEHKCRGYLLKYEGNMVYKCHNCGYSNSLLGFMKEYFPAVYAEARLDEIREWKEANSITDSSKDDEQIIKSFQRSAPAIRRKLKAHRMVAGLSLLKSVDDDNPIKQYAVNRGLTPYLGLLYYIPNVSEFMVATGRYEKPVSTTSDAIGIPHWSEDKVRLEYMQMRMNNPKFRYLTLRVDALDTTPKLFGLERMDRTRLISVTEGAFDSLFIDNCISISGLSDWKQVEALKVDKQQIRFLVDNDYRVNKQVMKTLHNIIEAGYSIGICDKTLSEYKDINDMAMDYDRDYINRSIETYHGLKAKLVLTR